MHRRTLFFSPLAARVPRRHVLRATAAGAAALAVTQNIDMTLTGRPPSEVPVLVVERLLRHPIHGSALRSAAGYGAQSTLAPVSVITARVAGGSLVRRSAAASAAALVGGAVVDGVLGAAEMPWRWSASDWARELVHKIAMGLVIGAATRPDKS